MPALFWSTGVRGMLICCRCVGAGRTTAEGEFIPCRSEQLDLDMIEGQLLLPLTIEHTIDERSPLCGHTYDTLTVRASWAQQPEGPGPELNPDMRTSCCAATTLRGKARSVHGVPGLLERCAGRRVPGLRRMWLRRSS